MEKRMYLIGNAHIDPVWLWSRREGYSEIKATFRSALDRMNEFGYYIFTSACAAYYQWVEENEPAMFEEIKSRVAEGRWAIAGGMWVQPDCNLPSGESLVRQLLVSQRYFREKFGAAATVGYNVDSFGHSRMLPQLLRGAGIDSYVFMRPVINEKQLPNLFLWESPDGSAVTAFRLTSPYCDMKPEAFADQYAGLSPYKAKVMESKTFMERDTISHMLFYGVGNHGGGPTVRCLTELDSMIEEDASLLYASPAQYFADITRENPPLPVVSEDLRPHAIGCYSADSRIKQKNRAVENRVFSAEKYDVMSAALTGAPSQKKSLDRALKKLLFNQFHDILCGCSIEDALDEACRYYDAAWTDGNEAAEFALQKLSWNIHTAGAVQGAPSGKEDWMLWEAEGQGAPCVVFNPHSFPVQQVIKLNHGKITGIRDDKGQPLPLQQVRGQQANVEDIYNTVFVADIPALGYATYYTYTKQTFTVPPTGLQLTESDDCFELRNAFITATVSKRTGCVSIDGCLEGGGQPVLYEDDTDTWAHGRTFLGTAAEAFPLCGIRVVDDGPVLVTVRAVFEYNHSVLAQEYSLSYADRSLSVRCKLDYHEKRRILRLHFPLAVQAESAVYEIPFGVSVQQCDGLEQVGHRFAGLSGCDGTALALINDAKYSFSADGHTMRMLIARSCGFADHYSISYDDGMEYMDMGRQTFCYRLLPYSAGQFAEVTQCAIAHNQPLEYIMETNHTGCLPTGFSGIHITADNVVCDTIKFAENGGGLILRLYETAGCDVRTEIRLTLGRFCCSFSADIKHNQVKTFLVDETGVQETNLLEDVMNQERVTVWGLSGNVTTALNFKPLAKK